MRIRIALVLILLALTGPTLAGVVRSVQGEEEPQPLPQTLGKRVVEQYLELDIADAICTYQGNSTSLYVWSIPHPLGGPSGAALIH